jgi:hypothetical protein
VAFFKKKKHLCTGTVWHSVFKIMQSLTFRKQFKECLYVAVTSRAVQRIPIWTIHSGDFPQKQSPFVYRYCMVSLQIYAEPQISP